MTRVLFILLLSFLFSEILSAQQDSLAVKREKRQAFLPNPVSRGRITIGGSADLSNTFRANNGGSFNFSIAPSFAYFVVRGLAVGARYSFGIGSSKSFDASKNQYVATTTFTTFVGPTVKYYVGKHQLKGVMAAQGGYAVYTALQGTSVFNLNGFAFGASAGTAHFFNKNLALETTFYFNTSGFETQLPSTRVGVSLGLFAFLDTKKRE